MGFMIRDIDFHILKGSEKNHSCIICLAGRSDSGTMFAEDYRAKSELDKTTIIGVTPYSDKGLIEWYPQPFSSTNQSDAVAGLKDAFSVVKKIVNQVESKLKIPKNRIAIAGFSAGGVMAMYTAMNSDFDLAGVVIHSGAILETGKIPQCSNEIPILLEHSRKDRCFSWYERYVPMKNNLIEKGYNVSSVEDPEGFHYVDDENIISSAMFLADKLGYEEFKHSLVEQPDFKTSEKEEIPDNWLEIQKSEEKAYFDKLKKFRLLN